MRRTPATASPAAERAGVLAMVGATLVWGATFVVIRDSLHAIGPRELVCGRFGVSAACLALVLAALRRPPDAATWRAGLASGACAAGGFLFQAVGLTGTSAGSSAFLTCVGTVLAALFAWPLLGQRPGGPLVRGILLTLAGSALLSWHGGLGFGRGELWTLLGAVLFALQIVAVGHWAGRADPLGLAAVQALAICGILLPWAPGVGRALAGLDAAGWWRFAYLAVPAGIVAPLLQILAQQAVPAGRIALLFALEPLFALAFALTAGGERFAVRWWWGAALIVSGVALVEWRILVAASPRPRPATP